MGTWSWSLPDLAHSKVCAQELEHARSAGKRIVPVAIRRTDPESVPTFLAELNWIDAIDSTSLESACDDIVEALETDLDHVKAHTRLTVKASEWKAKGEDGSLLLRGRDLEGAEATLASADREPRPTELQTRFVLASRKASGRRQRTGIAIAVCVALVAATLGLAAWIQRGSAVRNEQEAVARAAESRSRELASAAIDQLETDPELSLLLASEALKVEQTPEAVDSMRQSIDESRVRSSFTEHDGPVSVVQYSPDGDRLLTASYDGTARIQDLASGRTRSSSQDTRISSPRQASARMAAASSPPATTGRPRSGRRTRGGKWPRSSVPEVASSMPS